MPVILAHSGSEDRRKEGERRLRWAPSRPLIIIRRDTAENEVTRMYTLRPPEIRQRLLLLAGDKRLMRGPRRISRPLRRDTSLQSDVKRETKSLIKKSSSRYEGTFAADRNDVVSQVSRSLSRRDITSVNLFRAHCREA